MNPIFKDRVWELEVAPPWRAKDCQHCVEINQPEGAGALHISNARKTKGPVVDTETLTQARKECPEGTDIQAVRCGEFKGHVGEYIDWHTGAFWKKWFVACKQDMLFITYNCDRGEEELETEMVSALLKTLRLKA